MRTVDPDTSMREYAVRFVPVADGSTVPADVYVDVIRNVIDGLTSLRQTITPQLAARHGLSPSETKALLDMSIGPALRGSVVVPVQFGIARGAQPPLLAEYRRMQATFWRTAGQSLTAASRGRDRELVSAAAAERFAAAGSSASRSNVGLELTERRVWRATRGEWRSTVNLSRIHANLRTFAARRKEGMRSRIERIGQITDLTYEPLGFRLRVGDERILVRARAAMREEVRANWGGNVRVTLEALLDSDGSVSDAEAIGLAALHPAEDLLAEYLESRGSGRSIWSSEEGREYLADLRVRPDRDR